FEAWQEIEDFLASGPDDRHFVLDRAAGEVFFGDGRYGRIPTANPASPTANLVARRYLAGGGARGNVGVGAANVLQTAAPGVASPASRGCGGRARGGSSSGGTR